MSDARESSERTLSEQPVGTVKLEQVRNIPGGAMVRTLPTQQRFIMTPVQSSTALITSTTTLQAQVLPKVTVQGGTSRISAIPMQSTATSTSSYHVPKGPAAVANITVPRSTNVATPIVRGTSLQAITVAPHSIPGSISTPAAGMQIGRPVVSSVAPWIGVPSGQHSNIPRQPTAQLRPTIQQISGAKISNQVRPIDNQRMLVHSSTTHKQVITQQAQVQLSTGGNEQPKGTTVLKSYGGANASARLVAPPAPGLSRITTIPSAMAVSLHSAAAVLVPNNQGIPVKTTVAPPKVITQPVHSTTSIQFPAVCSAAVPPTLALNTVQVSRPGKPPALVTVMLSPSVASSGTSGPTSVTHIKPHPSSGGPTQLVPQNSSGGTASGVATVNKIYTTDNTHSGTNQPVFIQTQGAIPAQITQKSQQLPGALIVRESPRPKDEQGSGGGGVSIHSAGAVYSLTSSAYYDGPSYLKVPQHQSTAASLSLPSASQPASLHIRQNPVQTPSNSSGSTSHPNLGLRVNPIMVMESNRAHLQPFNCSADSSTSISSDNSSSLAALSLTSQALKQTTSPRPSILRKREPEGSPLKVTKNLNPVLSSFSVSATSPPPSSSSPPLKRPESGQSGQSSSGSTTISANSSPGESPNLNLKQEGLDDDLPQSVPSTNILHPLVVSGVRSRAPPTSSYQSHSLTSSSSKQAEMSPRKKPRKQQLSGNQIANEPTFSEDEMEFISEERMKKEVKEEPTDDADKVAAKRTMSLLSTYKHNWKGRNNHFNRYTDVKPKEERKPTLSEIANQKNVVQKLTGWKIYHIATHLEDLANNETEFFSEYNATLSFLEDKLGKCKNREMEKDFHRITERVKANYQRSRVVKDHMVEARAQLFKLLEHKSYISDIINRNTIKRPLKKRERV